MRHPRARTPAARAHTQTHGNKANMAHAHQLRAVILSHRVAGDHVEYAVQTQLQGEQLAVASRRYKEFDELHARLLGTAGAGPAIYIPDLPPKKFFGRMNPDFIAKRLVELQAYLDAIVVELERRPNPPTWAVLCEFLKADARKVLSAVAPGREYQLGIGADRAAAPAEVDEGLAHAESEHPPALGAPVGAAAATGGTGPATGTRRSSSLASSSVGGGSGKLSAAAAAEMERQRQVVEWFNRAVISLNDKFDPNGPLSARPSEDASLPTMDQGLPSILFAARERLRSKVRGAGRPADASAGHDEEKSSVDAPSDATVRAERDQLRTDLAARLDERATEVLVGFS